MTTMETLVAESIQPYPTRDCQFPFLNNLWNMDERFYYPNMCHICHCYGKNATKLKRCGACGMISYCSEEHQVKDWPSHKKFCKVICLMKKESKVDHLYQLWPENVNSAKSLHTMKTFEDKMKCHTSMTVFGIKLMQNASRLLKRKLDRVEYEIMEFPRICIVCYESNQKLLTNCANCPQASFCKQHLNDPSHESECSKFVIGFMTARPKMINENVSLFFNAEINETLYPIDSFPSSMLEFLATRLSTDLVKLESINATFTEEMRPIYDAFLSGFFTRSLTLIFAIKKLGLNLSSMLIHVVGSNYMEEVMTNWEVMFHFLPQLRELELILIGPGVLSNSEDTKTLCMTEKRKLTIVTKETLYHKYCNENSFRKPDIIACFTAGLSLYDTWEESVKYFNKGQCPLLVTSRQGLDGILDKEVIDSKFPSAKCVFNDDNPFSSFAYQREVIFFPVSAKNRFLFLYEFLERKK